MSECKNCLVDDKELLAKEIDRLKARNEKLERVRDAATAVLTFGDMCGCCVDAFEDSVCNYCDAVLELQRKVKDCEAGDETPAFTATVENKAKGWTLAPKKKALKSFVYQSDIGTFHICTKYQEDPEAWCKGSNYKLIKILDEIEVDI
jgi:hypothetical protein